MSGAFHNRSQNETESLPDFSQALNRLYSKMETAAATPEDFFRSEATAGSGMT